MKKPLVKNLKKYFSAFLIILFIFLAPSVFAAEEGEFPGERLPHIETTNTSKNPGNLGKITGLGGFQTIGIGEPGTFLEKVFSNLLGVFTVIAGLMLIIYFVLGAISWMTAGGDPEKVQKAQKQISNAVLGLVLVVLTYSIITIIGQILGLNILNPADDIEKLGPNLQN